MLQPDSETIVQDRAHLIQILKAMDSEQVIMYSEEDGNIILI